MKFVKMQGTGNDFVVIESNVVTRDWSQTAVAMCDRHFGIGADGLLIVSKSNVADFRMRLFNADGSEGQTCGNGLRCVARYCVEKGLTDASEISVETLAGVSKLRLYKTSGRLTKVRVGMGKPKFRAGDVPVVIEDKRWNKPGPILDYPVTVKGNKLSLSFVSMGTPHAVHFIPGPVADFPLSQIGPMVERLDILPDRVNFEIARVMPKQIEVRVWERGVGETLACGSGACAVAVVARLHRYIDSNKINIKLPGGMLKIEWDGDGEVFLNGPAETVFTGEWPD
ncbi:MAG: diaminopimelate epimerase [Chloroflexota bacterium]